MSCKIKFSFCCCFFFFNSNIENLTDDLNHFFPLVSSPRRIHKIYAIRMGVFCSNNKLRKKIQMHNRCMTLNSHFELSAFASICFIASFSLINNKNIRMHAKESIIEWTPSTCNRFAVRFVQLSLLKYNSLEHFFFWKAVTHSKQWYFEVTICCHLYETLAHEFHLENLSTFIGNKIALSLGFDDYFIMKTLS